MQLLQAPDPLGANLTGGVVTVGNFDGVHVGHCEILGQVRAMAERLGGPSIVFTFDPHPLSLLKPEIAPQPLTWPERKAELLGRQGIDYLVAYPTSEALLGMDYRQFFTELIVEQLKAKGIVEGPNFFFGRDRQGDIHRLDSLCNEFDVDLKIVDLVPAGEDVVSSSRIRRLVAEGEIEQANQMLTAPYLIRGLVVPGDQRGRQLGFPTANLHDCPVLVPGAGIYAARARTDKGWFKAAVHIGPNPTFGESHRKVEVHLLDFSDDLYGQVLGVEFHSRLRGVQTFESASALQQQLQLDVATVKARLGEMSADNNSPI